MKKFFSDNSDLFLSIFLFVSPFAVGGFYIFVSCAFSLALLVYLFCKKKNVFNARAFLSLEFVSLAVLVFSYLAVTVWALDRGTAIYGFFKFFPLVLFAAAVADKPSAERHGLLEAVPYSAAAITLITYPLSFFPGLSEYLLVAGRLGGTFQSPNAFALYCLCGIIILLTSEKIKILQWVCIAVLSGAVFLSGSRTVFVLLLLCIVFFVIRIKNKKVKIALGGIVVFCIAAASAVVVLTDNTGTVGRFLTISLNSSTLWGRLLYAKDAVKIAVSHPFGLGYYGYRFIQGSVQTGVYSVVNVHNELLQLLIDIGWVPALLFCAAFFKSLFSVNTGLRQKMLLLFIAAHSLFDFDLQFISIWFVLILSLDFTTAETASKSANTKAKNKKTALPPENKRLKICALAAAAVICAAGIYFGIINALFIAGDYASVEKYYGADTQAEMTLMAELDDYSEMSEYADSIIKRNKYIALAYDVKANSAYEDGDFQKFIEYKEQAVKNAKYSLSEYEDYAAKLLVGVKLYAQAGDEASARYCAERLLKIPSMLEDVKNTTSSMAWKIQDKPELELNSELAEAINSLKQ